MSIMSKADMVEVENLSRSDDPSQAFLAAEEYMDSLHSIDLQSDSELPQYFVSTCLPRIIIALLKRSDLEEDVEERAYVFLESTLLFIARTIDCGMEQLPLLLDEIFMERSHPFYVNSISGGRSPCADIADIGDADCGPEIFEDETRARRATFALRQPGRMYSRRGRGNCSEGRLICNINAFGRYGGFRRLKDAIMQAADPSQITRVRNLLSPVFEVKEFLATDFLDWFMTVFHHIADHILLRLSDDDLKNEFRSVNDIVNSLCGLYRLSSSATCQEHIDKLKLELALKGLRSRYLERRLSGLGEINDLLETLAGMMGENGGGQDGPCWADPEFMCGWLKSNEVLEEIFVHNVHTEVLKRSRRILLFLSEWGELGERAARMMWESSLGKHESIQKLIIDLLGQVARHLRTAEALNGLLKLVTGLPPSAFTTQHIELIRRIACLMIQMEKKEASTLDHFIGVGILWEMIQDSFQFSLAELHNFCLQCFVGLLELQECRQVRGTYFQKCVTNLKEHQSVPQSLMVMNGLFLAIAVKRKQPEIEWASFGCVQDEQELLDLVLVDLVWYQGLPVSSMDLDVSEDGLGPRYSRQEELQQRLSFISSILELEGGSLTENHLDCLWETLVKRAANVPERDLVFGWLEGLLRGRWTRDQILPVLDSLFSKYICSQDPVLISEVGFRLARFTMTLINSTTGMVEDFERTGEDGKLVITTTNLLKGTDFVWEVAVGVRNQLVAQQAIAFLNQMYQNLSPALQRQRQQVEGKRDEFIGTCMQHLQKAAGDANVRKMETRVSRCIWLLTSFLKEYEGNVASSRSGVLLRKHSVSAQLHSRASSNDASSHMAQAHSSRSSSNDASSLADEESEQKSVDSKDRDSGHMETVKGPEIVMAEEVKEDLEQLAANRDVCMQDGPDDCRSPHDILSQKYFDQIFQLLQASPGQISAQVWDLVGMLPTNEKMLNSLRMLEPGWAESFAVAGLYSLLYKMQIVERLMVEDSEWRVRFVSSGGLAAVLKVMLGVVFESETSAQKNACLALLLKLVSAILTSEPSVAPGEEEELRFSEDFSLDRHLKSGDEARLFVHGLMNILARAATAAPSEVQDEGSEQVVLFAVKLLTACAGAETRVLRFMYDFDDQEKWLRTILLQSESQSIRLSVANGILKMIWKQDGEWHDQFSLVVPFPKITESMDEKHASHTEDDASKCPHPLLWLLGCLLSLTSQVERGATTCGELFDLVSCVLNKAGQLAEQLGGAARVGAGAERLETTLGPMLDAGGHRIVARMRTHKVVEERGSEVEDRVLLGMLVTLQSILQLRPSLRQQLGPSGPDGKGLVHFTYCNCLFDLPTVEHHHKWGPPMCKLGTTRTAAFDLLLTLVKDSPAAYQELLALLSVQHSKHEVRPLHGYRPAQLGKARCGFVGMRNLGATCYMNSLLQHLFNVQEFRKGILQAPLEQGDQSASLMYQLQSLFGYLQESEKQFAETWEMCQVYTDYDGQPINTAIQMDADEFFNMLFEKLEECLKGTDQEHLLQECFGGKVVNQIICKEPVKVGDKVFGLDHPFKSEREESFYTLSLEVKHKRSVLESLDLFVEGEVLEGDNKYFCEEANCKVSAIKRVCIKQLPPTLILHLKRFEFDLDFMKKIKVNDSCEFPIVLNMEPYTRDGIERRERAQRQGRPAPPTPRGLDTEYELVGVLVHTGTSDSGHYYSYVKVGGDSDDEDGMWYLFNDTQVEAFDDEEIPAACYGGKEYVQDADGSCRAQAKSRSYSAYMLLYRQRRTAAQRARAKEAEGKPPKQGMALSSSGGVPVPQEIMETVWNENIQLLRDKLVYDPAYLSFVKRVCAQPRFHANGVDGQALEQGRVVLELASRVLMDTVIHAWGSAEEVETWVELIQSLLPGGRDGVERSRWLLDMFVEDVEERGNVLSHLWLFKGLVANRSMESRTSIVALLVQAARTVAEEERSVAWEPGPRVPFCVWDSSEESDSEASQPSPASTPRTPKAAGVLRGAGSKGKRQALNHNCPIGATTLARFIDKALELLPELPPHWRHFGEYFQLFSLIADFGQQEKAFFLSRRTVARCVDVFLHEDSPFRGEHRHRLRMGDKLSSPNFTYMMDLVAKLVCSVELERELEPNQVQEAPAPTQLPVVGVMDATSFNMVRHKHFVKKLLLEGVNPPKTLQLLQHLSWNHPRQSVLILQAACEVVESEEEYGVLFQILRSLLALQDALHEQRTDTFCVFFLKALYNNIQYPEACVRCLELLAEEIGDNPLLRNMVLRSIVLQNRRRDICRWFEACLLRCEGESIRLATEQVALAIAFPALRSAAAQNRERAGTPRAASGGAGHGRATWDQLSKTLFEFLISMDESLLHQAAVDRPRGFSSSPLASYIRCLSNMVQLADDAWFKAQFRRHFPKFHQLLDGLNELGHEMDVSKAELIRLLYVCAIDCPETLQLLTDQFSGIRESLLGYYIIIRPHKAHIIYNRQNLPYLYNLLLLCCKHSASFTSFVMGHRNSVWAVDNFICSSTRYPETLAVLLQIVDAGLNLRDQPEVLADFKRRILRVLLGSKAITNCPDNGVALFRRLVDDVLGNAEDLHELLESNLLECMFIGLAQSHPTCTGNGRRPFTPQEDTIANAIRILHKVLQACEARQVESESLCTALRKCKSRTLGVQALFKALKDASLPPSLRAAALDLCARLCDIDAGCATAGVSELARAYDGTKLKLLAEVRAAYGRGDVADRASGAAGGAKLEREGGQKAVQATQEGEAAKAESAESVGAGRATVQTVVELWPRCRGLAGAREGESVGLWWDLCAGLCRQCVKGAEDGNGGGRWQASVRLLLSCVVDSLPDSVGEEGGGHVVKLVQIVAELLQDCRSMTVGTEGGREASGRVVKGETDAKWVLEALQGDDYSSAFCLRVMLCYKDLLEAAQVREVVVALLKLVVPNWGTEWTRRVMLHVFKDMLQVAEGVKGGGGEGEAKALACKLLQEARPLRVVQDVPALVAAAVEERGDCAGGDEVRRALEAAGAPGVVPTVCSQIEELVADLQAAMRKSKTG